MKKTNETWRLKQEITRLRSVCAEAYQLAGAYFAPTAALANLWAAAQGESLPHDSFLPIANQFADDLMLFNWLLVNRGITRYQIRREIVAELQEACSGGLRREPFKPSR